jgi:hypothetical protein
MSTLGFTRGAGGPRGRMRIPVPPQSEQMQRFIAQQTQKAREDKAAQAALNKGKSPVTAGESSGPSSAAPNSQQFSMATPNSQTATPNYQTPSASRGPRQPIQTQVGGIEDKIAKTEVRANSAHALAASVRSDFSKHMGETERRFESSKARLAELEGEVDALRRATRDAWMATFWMYADVVQSAAIMDAPPPKGKTIWITEAPSTAVLFGEMVDTAAGPCMQCRWVKPDTGQLSSGWMLLRTSEGHQVLTNFRLHY